MRILFFLGFVFITLFGCYEKKEKKYHANKNERTIARVDSLIQLAEKNLYVDSELSFKQSEKALTLAQNVSYIKGRGAAYQLMGYYYFFAGNDQNALTYYNKAISEFSSLESLNTRIAPVYYAIGNVYHQKLNLELALTNYYKALNYYDETKDQNLILLTKNYIANVFNRNQNPSEALNYLNEILETPSFPNQYKVPVYQLAAEIFRNKQDYTTALRFINNAQEYTDNLATKNIMHLFTSTLYFENNQLEYAEKELKKAEKGLQKLNHSDTRISFHILKGKILTKKSQYSNALKQFDMAEKMARELNFNNRIIQCLIEKSVVWKSLNNTTKAIKLLSNAITIENSSEDYESLINIIERRAELYKLSGNNFLAVQDYETLLKTKKRYNDKVDEERLALMKVKFDYNDLSNQLKINKIESEIIKEKKQRTEQMNLFLFIAIAVILFTAYLIIQRQYELRKMNAIRWEHEKNLIKDTRAEAEKQLRYKNELIESYLIKFKSKRDALKNIQEQLDTLEETPIIRLLIKDIGKELEKENNANLVKELSDESTSIFLKRLEEKFPDLSEQEKQIVVYIKTGMSSKDIGQLTQRSYLAINNLRTSIRKKFKLERSQNLTEFILKI